LNITQSLKNHLHNHTLIPCFHIQLCLIQRLQAPCKIKMEPGNCSTSVVLSILLELAADAI